MMLEIFIAFDRVPCFEASKYKVTNRQMLAFVKAGGYDKRQYWTDEAWEWKEFRDVRYVLIKLVKKKFWVAIKSK